jgi:hypothetical protein
MKWGCRFRWIFHAGCCTCMRLEILTQQRAFLPWLCWSVIATFFAYAVWRPQTCDSFRINAVIQSRSEIDRSLEVLAGLDEGTCWWRTVVPGLGAGMYVCKRTFRMLELRRKLEIRIIGMAIQSLCLMDRLSALCSGARLVKPELSWFRNN